MKEFIKGIFSSGTPESSKRVFGAIGFICSIAMMFLKYDEAYWGTLLMISSLLLGLETITGIFKKKENE